MYNWSDYVAPDNIEAFKAATGIDNFTYDTFASNDELLTKLQGGATGQWDFGAPTAEFVPGDARPGLHPEARHVADPERQVHRQGVQGPVVGPDRRVAAAQGLGHDRDRRPDEGRQGAGHDLEGVPRHRPEVLGPDRRRRLARRRLRRAAQGSRPLAQLDRPGRAWSRPARTCWRWRRTSSPSTRTSTPRSSRPRRPCSASSGPATCCRCATCPATADTVYNIPADGTLFWLDTWVIFNEAPHLDAAYAFLNFIHDPEVQAKETEFNYYASPNDEAKKYIDPKILERPGGLRPGRRAGQARGRQGPVARPDPDHDLGGVQVEDRELTFAPAARTRRPDGGDRRERRACRARRSARRSLRNGR